MTQKQLIDKWRRLARELRKQAREAAEYSAMEEYEVLIAQAEIFDECANDLEALTY